MDEATLTRTLQSLAAGAPLHPAPSADAKRRASRLRRNRRTGAAGLVAVVALAVVTTVTVQPNDRSGANSSTPSWVQQLSDPTNPNHSTTGYIGISRAAGGEWVVYWQGRRLCYEVIGVSALAGRSECSSPVPTTATITQANIGAGSGGLFFAVSKAVARVDSTTVSVAIVPAQDGKNITVRSGNHTPQSPLGQADFPASVVVAEGKVISLRAMDKAGQQIGATMVGPAAPQLRQVLGTFSCTDTSQTGFDLILPQLDQPKSCYGLGPAAMTFVPKAARAVNDATLGWLVQIALDNRDRTAFAQLTRRLVSENEPKNQLAIVFDGKVLSAPTIEESIANGVFDITGGTTAFTQDQALTIAGDFAG
jgi:hypothetical protein